jgi:putative membrane protein
MIEFLIHLLITAGLLLLVAKMIPGVDVESWGAAIFAALVLGLVNAVIKPLLVFLSLPITWLTFGLFYLVINALMLWLVAAIVPGVKIKGFGPAFLGALALSLLNLLVSAFFGLASGS